MKEANRVFYKPRQVIPESKKNRDWATSSIDYFISLTGYGVDSVRRLYNAYNGIRDEEDFKYLTETYGIQYPAKLKHIPLIKPMIDNLRGEEWKRGLDYVVRSEDSNSIELKIKEISDSIYKKTIDLIATIDDQNKREEIISELAKDFKYNYQSALEVSTHKFLSHLINKLDLKQISSELIHELFVTGREIYKVRIDRAGEYPQVKVVDPENFWFSADDDIKWIADAEWCVERVQMTPTEILDRFGEDMTLEERESLENYLELYDKGALKINNGANLDNSSIYQSVDGVVYTPASIWVYYVQWKSVRKINLLESENKYAEEYPFIKYLHDEEVRKLPSGKREKVTVRYVQDLYEGVRIGTDIYVNIGKSYNTIRSVDQPSKCKLHYNGKINNFHSEEPYSLVGVLKDLQDLYDILHFHKENLIALSGSKGVFMDLSQLPDFSNGDMSEDSQAQNIKMWLYYKKMGIAFIDRAKETADKTFNQFQNYDDTLGAGVQGILTMIQHVETVAERVTGVSRQVQGRVFQYDGKGTTEQAIIQSSLTTEPLFMEHYSIFEQLLEDLLNASRIAFKDGLKGTYITNEYLNDFFTLDEKFSITDFGVYLTNNKETEKQIQELKAYALEMVKSQAIDLVDVMSLVGKTSLKEVKYTLEESYARKRREAEQNLQAQTQAQTQQQDPMIQIKQQELQMKGEIEKAKLELEKEKLEIQRSTASLEAQLEKQRIELEKIQLYTDPKSVEVRNE